MPEKHQLISSKTVFKGGLLEVLVDEIKLPDGSTRKREIVRHPGAVGVVALSGDGVLLVRQNRHAIDDDLLEIPAGKLDAGEDPEKCGRRELLEETGYEAAEVERLTTFLTSPGFSDEKVHLFLTTSISRRSDPPEADEGEPISIEWLPFDDAIAQIQEGKIVDSKTIIGLLLARERLTGRT
jgi:ADP-ribose pyrophosphatase